MLVELPVTFVCAFATGGANMAHPLKRIVSGILTRYGWQRLDLNPWFPLDKDGDQRLGRNGAQHGAVLGHFMDIGVVAVA